MAFESLRATNKPRRCLMTRVYRYVGPAEIAAEATGKPGVAIHSREDLQHWVKAQQDETPVTATYVVDAEQVLRIAPRRSEHVACAGGGAVCAAGELVANDRGAVIEVSNQSTGYCPDPGCWASLHAALDSAGIDHPATWTASFTFRRCESCGQRCIVKDEWFECDVCGAALPEHWNFQ